MSLINIQPWLLRARREHFALGAFNANTLEQAQAIVAAAEQERAPVLVQISRRALEYVGNGNPTLGLRYLARIGTIAAESVSVPIALHLDHATEEQVLQAMALGFISAMFDGGDFPFEENIRVTKRLCERAHALGISIEAELGEVPRADSLGNFAARGLTDPDQAAEFVRVTGVDSLAIAIGSVHAIKQKSVRLDLEQLKAIRTCVEVPLVLHGSSGVIDDDIAAGIALGLCKVNVATQLNQAFTGAVRAQLASDSDQVDPREYLLSAREAVVAQVGERIRFFGSAGKAT